MKWLKRRRRIEGITMKRVSPNLYRAAWPTRVESPRPGPPLVEEALAQGERIVFFAEDERGVYATADHPAILEGFAGSHERRRMRNEAGQQ